VDAMVLPWATRPWHIVQESVFATCSHMVEALRAGREAATSARDERSARSTSARTSASRSGSAPYSNFRKSAHRSCRRAGAGKALRA
jgi:hypothetical protein